MGELPAGLHPHLRSSSLPSLSKFDTGLALKVLEGANGFRALETEVGGHAMTFGKAAGMTLGFIGAFGLGVAVGPSMTDRDHQTAASPTAQVSDESNVNAAPAARPSRVTRKTASTFRPPTEAVIVAPATHAELQKRLKPVLNRGANMTKAADGFRNGEEFATVAHAARNTNVPFMVLKHRVLEQQMSLSEAIQASQPAVDVDAEVAKARSQAKSDLAEISL